MAGLVRQRKTLDTKIDIAQEGMEAAKQRVSRVLQAEQKKQQCVANNESG